MIYLYLNGMGIKVDGNSEVSVKTNISIQKLEKALRKDGMDISLIKNRFYFDKAPWWEDRKNLNFVDSIIKSTLESTKLDVSYQNRNGECSKRRIRPYGLVVKDAEWYLVSYCESSKDLRIFKCDRIMECQETYEHFIIPDNFSLKDYFIKSSELFTARCRETERYIVTLRIPSKEIDLLKECEIYSTKKQGDDIEAVINMYTYSRAVSEFWNILLRSYVIEPAELKDSVKTILQSAARFYGI